MPLIPNTFGIEAQCREFINYDTTADLLRILPRLRQEKWLHIGSGSNLLFTTDFDGIILHSAIRTIDELKRDQHHVWLRVGAGYVWDDFVSYCVDHNLHGLENLSLIPGEVGASAVQNIGAYGKEAAQNIEAVRVVDIATGECRTLPVEECQYAYRSSIFKHSLRQKCIVTHVDYKLSLTFTPNLDYGAISRELQARSINPAELTATQLRNIIIEVRRAKLPDPDQVGSAGSFFMNPVVSHEKFEELLAAYPAMPHYPAEGGVKIPAGWMIEQCGWKGKSLGRAGVYAKQALVLVNLGGATGSEIVALSKAVRADVNRKFGIDIHPEVNFI